MTKYKLVRSNRKTLALHITAQGLEVRAPRFMPLGEIERFVKSKESWIDKHLHAAPHEHARGRFLLGYGDTVSFRGGTGRIVGSPEMRVSKPGHVRGRYMDGEFLITEGLDSENIRFVLSFILKCEAAKYIPGRVQHYSEWMGLNPRGVRITSAFGRWGSCSAEKRLNFAWMLMMADDAAIDSVVVHELSHMIYMNHSPDFYKTVKTYCPDYDNQRKKLKELGRKIGREGWKR
jgi:predicted metal-dependent hydrolase